MPDSLLEAIKNVRRQIECQIAGDELMRIPPRVVILPPPVIQNPKLMAVVYALLDEEGT